MIQKNQHEKIYVIVNPKAGSQQAQKKLPEIKKYLQKYFEHWKVETTKAPKHAIHLAQKAAQEGFDIVAIVGGDGSCHEAVQGLMSNQKQGKPVPIFALIPFGTGGDLRKTLHVPQNISKAIQVAAFGEDRIVDVGQVKKEGANGTEVEYFINVAGFGANGEVVERSNRWSKRLGGRITFLNATVYTSMTYQSPNIHLEWTNSDSTTEQWTGKMLSCFVANAQFCGGGMKIAPDHSIEDGYLHLRLLPEMSVPKQLFHMPKLYSNQIDQVEGSICRKITELKAATAVNHQVRIDLDGELSGILPAHFSVIPKALTIRGVWK